MGIRNHLAPVGGHQQITLAGANDCPAACILRIRGEAGKNLGVLREGLAEIELHPHGGRCKPADKGLALFFRRPGRGRAPFCDFLRLQNVVSVHVLYRKLRFLWCVVTAREQRDDHCGDQQQSDPFYPFHVPFLHS